MHHSPIPKGKKSQLKDDIGLSPDVRNKVWHSVTRGIRLSSSTLSEYSELPNQLKLLRAYSSCNSKASTDVTEFTQRHVCFARPHLPPHQIFTRIEKGYENGRRSLNRATSTKQSKLSSEPSSHLPHTSSVQCSSVRSPGVFGRGATLTYTLICPVIWGTSFCGRSTPTSTFCSNCTAGNLYSQRETPV